MIPQENKLLDLLSNNDVTFFIPPYQRNYEWTDEQCKVFLADICKTAAKNQIGKKVEHFFGSITYVQNETAFGEPNILVLIDGQQRITTTMLFLVAIRDIIGDSKIEKFIETKYLKNNSTSEDSEYKIKLKQVETDWAAYRDIILGEKLNETEKNSAVYRNYSFFKNVLLDYREKGIDLNGLIVNGISKFSVITIELQPVKNEWENPQEIFESMNSLGKPLSLADLVRNYLMLGLNAEKQTDLYKKYWLRIEKTVPRKVSDFIRDYMQGYSAHAYPKATDSNHKELYSIFKSLFEGANSEGLLSDLSKYSSTYSYIAMDRSCGNEKIDLILKDLRTLNVTTAYSFLLKLMNTWEEGSLSDEDIISILNSFRIYCLRRRLLGLTQGENKAFPVLTKRIPELVQAEDRNQKMFQILATQENRMRLPNDIEISRYLETTNFYNTKYCKFYLALVEEKLTRSRPDLDDSNLQIEHIMPQKLNADWMEALGEDYEMVHQENVHSIGNLTLIRHNQIIGQKKFSDKKIIYEEHAGLQIARKEITNQKTWDKKAIQKRAKWIIGYLLSNVMPIPEEMKKMNNFNSVVESRLSFVDLQLIGMDIDFIPDPSIVAHVVSDKEVEFEGKKWKLSPLTKELQARRGVQNESSAYSGAQYWEFDGIRLRDIL